ncbi:MAG: polysaccharide pyruvyl transferase family protein [Hyphomicrobiaceae bacterium]|nr:polysaccharide pyruvyl transferase family protein [Hyphomicrobiaceae bacterium]
MRVCIFNLKYSPNLGDGAIAECLEHALRERGVHRALSIDLAGRQERPRSSGGRRRAFLLGLLQRIPGWLGDAGVALVLGWRVRRRLRPFWRAKLQAADVVIFGGGQLIQDADLNFPIKLAAAADECRRRGLPVALFAVGAAPLRRRRGRHLFRRLVGSDRLAYAAVRDESSRLVLRELGCDAAVCRDPALLAASLWPMPARAGNGRPRVGLGITHPAVLAHHSSRRETHSVEVAARRYADVALRLAASGLEVVCFTNGAAEDELLLAAVGRRLGPSGGAGATIRLAARQERPQALARLIADCDAIVAHRLHAAILAFAYRVPMIGLRWDDKLASFLASVGMADRLVSFDDATAGNIERLVARALSEGIAAEAHARVVAETEAGIDGLLAALAGAVRVPSPAVGALQLSAVSGGGAG